MDLNSLARTLAERLTTKLDEMVEFETFKNGRTAGFLRRGASEHTEAVIREAIEKTLEEAEKAVCPGCANDIPIANGGGLRMHVDPHSGGIMVCHATAIRSLKQSSSGIAEQGIVRE